LLNSRQCIFNLHKLSSLIEGCERKIHVSHFIDVIIEVTNKEWLKNNKDRAWFRSVSKLKISRLPHFLCLCPAVTLIFVWSVSHYASIVCWMGAAARVYQPTGTVHCHTMVLSNIIISLFAIDPLIWLLIGCAPIVRWVTIIWDFIHSLSTVWEQESNGRSLSTNLRVILSLHVFLCY
jgi:hypothetical protein